MDPQIWSNTPPIIQELVFARLPLQSLIQLRLLSKQWHSYLTSPAFQLSFGDGRPMGFAVVEGENTGHRRVWAYDARARSWLGLPLAYLPFSFLVAADGGLLCFVKYAKLEERLQVVVCNPLTCTWRELPPAVGVRMFPKSVQMKVDMNSKHYTIKFLGVQSIVEPELFHVYSSVTESWVRLDCSRQPEMVGHYILVNVYLGSIHTYDIKPGASSSTLCPPDFDLDIVAQVEGSFLFQAEHGCLFLLKTLEGKRSEERDQKLETKWEHFSHIPKAELLQNYYFSVFLCGDSILLLGENRKLFYDATHEIGDDLGHTGDNLMLMLDMSTKTWTEVTDHNIEPTCLSRYIVELRLDAVP